MGTSSYTFSALTLPQPKRGGEREEGRKENFRLERFTLTPSCNLLFKGKADFKIGIKRKKRKGKRGKGGKGVAAAVAYSFYFFQTFRGRGLGGG